MFRPPGKPTCKTKSQATINIPDTSSMLHSRFLINHSKIYGR